MPSERSWWAQYGWWVGYMAGLLAGAMLLAMHIHNCERDVRNANQREDWLRETHRYVLECEGHSRTYTNHCSQFSGVTQFDTGTTTRACTCQLVLDAPGAPAE